MKKESQSKAGFNPAALFSTVGIVVAIVLVALINFIAGQLGGRIDLTENNIYTLSSGTREILKELDTPVTVRFYATDSRDMMSPAERTFARRVEDMLREFKKIAGSNLILEKLNPEPNTDAEDSASLDGIQPVMSQETGNQIFLGVAFRCIDQKEVIPFVSPQQETLMEYNFTNAIARVYNDDNPNVKIMTGMDIAGGFSPAGPTPEWFLHEQLAKDFDVEVIDTDTPVIPEDTSVLIVLHPYDISESGEYAIDQFLLKGGNVIALVDPLFFSSRVLQPQQNPMMQGMPPQEGPAPSSDLGTLFDAWGIEYQSSQALADRRYQTMVQGGQQSPTVVSLSEDAMNRDNPVTSQLNDVFLPMPGGFTAANDISLSYEPLLMSSEDNQLISTADADPTTEGTVDRLRQEFKPSGKERMFAGLFYGDFKTAFPSGNPANPNVDPDAGAEPEVETEAAAEGTDEAEAAPEVSEHLSEATDSGRLVVIADVDFVFDQFAVQVMNFGGMRLAQPSNQNLAFFQNLVEFLGGDERLLSVRSRATTRRPFTLLNQMVAEAESQMMGRLQELQQQEQEVNQQLAEILSIQSEAGGEVVIPEEQVQQIENLRRTEYELSQEIREMQKELRRQVERTEAGIKFVNIAVMPLVIIIIGLMFYGFRQTRTAAR